MNRTLTKQELADVAAAHPITEETTMTRDAKLERLATLVENCPRHISLFDRIEEMTQGRKERATLEGSVFALAAGDKTFQKAGLTGQTVADGQKFFELSNEELHHLSCNCGGQMHRDEVANRLRGMKGRVPSPAPTISAGRMPLALLWLIMMGSSIATLALTSRMG